MKLANVLPILFLCLICLFATAQVSPEPGLAETHHYAIEMAGIRVGTMTVMRQSQVNDRVVHTIISDVKVNLLVYTVNVYYKVVNQFDGKKLLVSTVNVRTNRGDYLSRTEWKSDHYDITANQYKYTRQTTGTQLIDLTSSLLYFSEPVNRSRVYAEYFGDYFRMKRTATSTYQATINDRKGDYLYENGRLVNVIKHNSLKNFVIRFLE